MYHTALADDQTARCAYYRHTCDLPAGLRPDSGRITIRAGHVAAITMPAALGQSVTDDLARRGMDPGPVISQVRSQRWAFLVRPDLPEDMRLFAELFRLNVSIVPEGSEIALPSPADDEYRQWIFHPHSGFRLTASAVVDAVRSCARAPRR